MCTHTRTLSCSKQAKNSQKIFFHCHAPCSVSTALSQFDKAKCPCMFYMLCVSTHTRETIISQFDKRRIHIQIYSISPYITYIIFVYNHIHSQARETIPSQFDKHSTQLTHPIKLHSASLTRQSVLVCFILCVSTQTHSYIQSNYALPV